MSSAAMAAAAIGCGGAREVAGFLLCNAQCVVQIALWGDVAKTYFDKILQWLAETPDGKFPKVKIEQHPKGGTQQIGGCVPRFSQIFRGRNEQTDLCWLHWNPSVV